MAVSLGHTKGRVWRPDWAPFTNYPTKGAMVTNPNNGGAYRVEVPGTSGAAPGPIKVRPPRVDVLAASTVNIPVLSGLLTIDGVALPEAARVLVKESDCAGNQWHLSGARWRVVA